MLLRPTNAWARIGGPPCCAVWTPRPSGERSKRTAVRNAGGRITAKRLLPIARAAGYQGSARNFRLLVATVKRAYKAEQGLSTAMTNERSKGGSSGQAHPFEVLGLRQRSAEDRLSLACAMENQLRNPTDPSDTTDLTTVASRT